MALGKNRGALEGGVEWGGGAAGQAPLGKAKETPNIWRHLFLLDSLFPPEQSLSIFPVSAGDGGGCDRGRAGAVPLPALCLGDALPPGGAAAPASTGPPRRPGPAAPTAATEWPGSRGRALSSSEHPELQPWAASDSR